MAEAMTHNIVYNMMSNVGMTPYPEECPIVEVQEALATASKNMTGKKGRPDVIARVGNYLIIVENKANVNFRQNI